MPQTVNKTLAFPLAGVVRRGGYRDQTRPYSAPWAVNVRGAAPLEGRERGGSRPGLVEIAGVTTTAEGDWEWEDGSTIEWESGGDITYDYAETLIETSDGIEIINPASLISVLADKGEAPTDYTISCIYRDRVVLGKGALWYASRAGDHADWDYGAEMTDIGRAVAGTVELAGQTGSDLTAIIPHRDKALIFATNNSLHILGGDPVTGKLQVIDEDIGIIAPYGWALNGEELAFLSNDGVYVGNVGSRPARFSEGRIPDELKNVDVDSNTIVMAYDPGARGYHLFITPASGTGSHYFLDIENKAIWPVVFGDAGHQPVIAARVKSDNLERVYLQGRDTTWREFVSSAVDDDGETLQSHVLIGPVRTSANDVRDALLAELHGIMAQDIGSTVTWHVIMGESAESTADTAVAAVNAMLANGTPEGVADSGTWSEGRNRVNRPRSRGPWMIVWISAETKWAYEAVAIVARQFGRNR